ncbi:hypothetical protein HPB48_011928 [Haemaphysalis longicornis]|uniref:Uncharacterized protein n=1 Tax=Haemaphysalis longicornis TaxID=44386 RepID=A0A9J6FY88_HAELO|nr:hypothetical protein HPB48_011928 [Haemaphysalis longicornis]
MYSKGNAWPHEEYIYNQDQNISTQLAYGIRCLDLRVMYYGNVFYVSHANWRGWPTIRQVLLEVRQFVKKTGELVLLDFHRFNQGFQQDAHRRHKQLVSVIVDELGDVLLEKTSVDDTLGFIFGFCDKKEERKGHVLVFYNAEYKGWGDEYLANPIFHQWPNAQTVPQLLKYLQQYGCPPFFDDNLISAMAEMTPKFSSLIIGNRRAAQLANHAVTELFRTNLSECNAIVATDYFLGNNIIGVAIEANLDRGKREARHFSYASFKDCKDES